MTAWSRRLLFNARVLAPSPCPLPRDEGEGKQGETTSGLGRWIAFGFLAYISSCLVPIAAWGDEVTFRVLPAEIFQGDAVLVRGICARPIRSMEGEFGGKRFSFYPEEGGKGYAAILGVDLETAPGERELLVYVRGPEGPSARHTVTIRVGKKDFAVQNLTLPKRMVTLSRTDLERANREKAIMERVLSGYAEDRAWRAPFIMPVQGEVISSFGLRRVLNQEPRNPHSGIDLRAAEGTPVVASSNGIVVLADDHFFSGKSIVLDHGLGLFTMYFHLSEIDVREGQKVAQGETIGKVGKTGRATGPHLHWGVRIRGSRVDPLSLVRLFQ